jgi:cytochrome c-type biogenesis protein
MQASQVTIGLAALAGLASFLSPCVLAIVPAYISYLGGRSLRDSMGSAERWRTFSHGLAFVVGFGVVFVLLGIATSAIGVLLYDLRGVLSKVGGVAVVLFGLHTLGVVRIPWLDMDTRNLAAPNPNLGYFSSVMMGVVFSAGWAPCVGPVLGAVLTLSLSSARLQEGAILLTAYTLGMAVPFLLAALGVGRLTEFLRRNRAGLRVVKYVTGGMMLILGVLLFTGSFEGLARFGFFVDLGL